MGGSGWVIGIGHEGRGATFWLTSLHLPEGKRYAGAYKTKGGRHDERRRVSHACRGARMRARFPRRGRSFRRAERPARAGKLCTFVLVRQKETARAGPFGVSGAGEGNRT